MIIWIVSGQQREQVAWALISNDYEVKQIEKPDDDYPYTRKNYGLEFHSIKGEL